MDVDFSKFEGRRSNKAILRSLMPQLLALKSRGYRLTDVYKFLKAQGVLTCTKGNFDRYFYKFANEPGSYIEQTLTPSVELVNDTRVDNQTKNSASNEVARSQISRPDSRPQAKTLPSEPAIDAKPTKRIGDDYDPKADNALAQRFFDKQ